MLDITLDTNLPNQIGKLALLTDRQFRFAVAQAMTDAALAAQAKLKADMPSYIDRPTPFTENSTYVSFANPNRLTAEVGFKFFGAKNPAGQYLNPLARGGDRKAKPSEWVLRYGGVIKRDQFVVPLPSWRGDAYGNVPRGTYTMMLSQLKAFTGSLATMNASNSARSRRKRETAGQFFVVRSRELGEGPKGIFYRAPDAPRHQYELAFAVLDDAPNYERRFPIRQILNDEYSKSFQRLIQTSLTNELRRAGFG
jgi:hypothetical protein